MSATTLDDFMALNDQLAALASAGVPLDLGLKSDDEDAKTTLERINAAVARRVGRGASLDEALAVDGDQLPAPYRCLVQVGLRSGRLDAALDGSQRVAETVEQTRHSVWSAVTYPLIVCVLAIVGLACFRVFLAPILQDTYASLDLAPGRGLRALLKAPGRGDAWLAAGGGAAVLLAAWRLSRQPRAARTGIVGGGLLRRTPGAAAAISLEQWASFASSLSSLLAAGTPLTEALQLSACASGADRIRDAVRGLADWFDERSPSDMPFDHPALDAFPPFLRWAILTSEPDVGRVRALDMAATLYRSTAQQGVERVRALTPAAACIVLGGGAALIYALALFLPVTELLTGIAAANAGP